MMYFKIVIVAMISITLRANAAPFHTEEKIIRLSETWNENMMVIAKYEGLMAFCNNDIQRKAVFNLLDEIHYYHDVLEEDLRSTTYNHSKKIIGKILKQIDRLQTNYHPKEFVRFFREQCELQNKIERNSDHYSAGFGTHSLDGKVYVQQVEMYRYLKGLTKKIDRIKKHVKHFHVRRTVWEY